MIMSFGFGDDSSSGRLAVGIFALGAARASRSSPLGGRMPLVTALEACGFGASIASPTGDRLAMSTPAATGSASAARTSQIAAADIAVFIAAHPSGALLR